MSEIVLHATPEERTAQHFVDSRLIQSIKNVPDAMVLMMCGKSLGLSDFDSVTGIHMVDGRPQISANLMASAIKRHDRYDYKVTQYTETAVTVEFFEVDAAGVMQSAGDPVTWTIEMAKTAGLASRTNWKNYPRQMLRSRAISEGYRTYCPDALGNVTFYVEGEIDTPRRDVTPRPIPEMDLLDQSPVATHAELGALSLLIADVEKFQPSVKEDMEAFYKRPVLEFTTAEVNAATVQLQNKLRANDNA
tara:strand:+ start:313 stop:1056 length:744 start_codon:yes stop_codon:yes gene_type:complete